MSENLLTPVKGKDFNLSARRVWTQLTEPASTIQGIERRPAQLLSAMVISLALVGTLVTLGTTFLPVSTGNESSRVVSILSIVLIWVIYFVSRSRHFKLAVLLTIALVDAAIVGLAVTGGALFRIANIDFLIIGVILSGMLLSSRSTVYLIIGNSILIALLPVFIRDIPPVGAALGFFDMVSALFLVFIWHRNVLEQDRQADLARSLQRTEEANKALLQANALSKEAIRLKSEFMSTMSHELRTPLNAIAGFCGIMLEGMGGEFDDESRHMLERMQSNSDRLLILINQVLDIAKIEADRLDLVSSPLSAQALADRWKSQSSVLADNKGLTFDIEVDPALPLTFYGDPERLTQIAMNLLSNAVKFTEKGGITLALKRSEDKLLIEVRDTGIGIPPHALHYIFDEFRQLDGSSRRAYGGSGLGLAIVRKLCLIMDGHVRVSSTLGQGSVFTVTLPLRTTDVVENYRPERTTVSVGRGD